MITYARWTYIRLRIQPKKKENSRNIWPKNRNSQKELTHSKAAHSCNQWSFCAFASYFYISEIEMDLCLLNALSAHFMCFPCSKRPHMCAAHTMTSFCAWTDGEKQKLHWFLTLSAIWNEKKNWVVGVFNSSVPIALQFPNESLRIKEMDEIWSVINCDEMS